MGHHASGPFNFEAHHWRFPLVGEVSYKGFFDKHLAVAEFHHLVSRGFDVDLRPASAWSTLGWFNDPLLSNMLNRSKSGLCNLLFHELFHATYYAPGSVDLNENLASFVAHKATQLFLKKIRLNWLPIWRIVLTTRYSVILCSGKKITSRPIIRRS